MIPINELRIGNYILSDGIIVKVTGLSDEYRIWWKWHLGDNVYNADNDREDQIDPIPLTMEILEKCGFSGAWTTINGLDGNLMGVKLPELEYEIKYVHQLQNLYFALTGNELNITL